VTLTSAPVRWICHRLILDLLTVEDALALAGKVAEHVDIIELGTPLIKAAGLSAVTAVKAAHPDKIVLADMKTMDAGELEADIAFKAGADVAVAGGPIYGAADPPGRKGTQGSHRLASRPSPLTAAARTRAVGAAAAMPSWPWCARRGLPSSSPGGWRAYARRRASRPRWAGGSASWSVSSRTPGKDS
jgi:hypothetical protein